MSDEEIISTLIKGRERCRQLVQLYQQVRNSDEEEATLKQVHVKLFNKANRLLSQVLGFIQNLPEKPTAIVRNPEKKKDADRILREMGDLLARAMVAEKETREHSSRPHHNMNTPFRNPYSLLSSL